MKKINTVTIYTKENVKFVAMKQLDHSVILVRRVLLRIIVNILIEMEIIIILINITGVMKELVLFLME